MNTYLNRQKKVSSLLAREDISLLVLCDREGMRNPSIRYLTGQPSDSVLFIFADGRTILLPWDINLAQIKATATQIKPYNDYGRTLAQALAKVLKEEKLPAGSRVEVPAELPYPEFMRISQGPYQFICREGGLAAAVDDMRQIKDSDELATLRKAFAITDDILDKIEAALRSGQCTETDIALLIDREARLAGAEGTGFETLAAAMGRSYNIHAFPAYTGAMMPADGLSIIDFGVKYDGYTSDVTTTITRNLNPEQDNMVSVIEGAVKVAEKLLKPGTLTTGLSGAVNDYLEKNGYVMPHNLGHGIGLYIHEKPFLRAKVEPIRLEKGMVFTIEPGVYDPELGGVRLENDYLITDTGYEKLTNSRIIRL